MCVTSVLKKTLGKQKRKCVCVCACVSEGALARGYACGVDFFLLGLLPGIVRGSHCGRIRGVVASLRVPGVCACAAFVLMLGLAGGGSVAVLSGKMGTKGAKSEDLVLSLYLAHSGMQPRTLGPHQLFKHLTACNDAATSWTLDTEISHATKEKCHEFIFRVLMLINRMEIGVWVVRPEVVDDIEFAFSSLETAVMADKLQSQETINNNTNRKK